MQVVETGLPVDILFGHVFRLQLLPFYAKSKLTDFRSHFFKSWYWHPDPNRSTGRILGPICLPFDQKATCALRQ